MQSPAQKDSQTWQTPELQGTPGPDSALPVVIGAEEAVEHARWRDARAKILAAAFAKTRLILLLGTEGAGKTLLMQDLAWTLRAACVPVLVHPRGRIPVAAGTAGDPERPHFVLIDEAGSMNLAALQRLDQLRNCVIILAARADPFAGRLFTPPALTVRLEPVADIASFMAERLINASLAPDLIADDAMARLAVHSGGNPLLLNTLAARALSLARADAAASIQARHVDRASAMPLTRPVMPPNWDDDPLPPLPPAAAAAAIPARLAAPVPPPPRRRWLGASVAVAAAILAIASGFLAQSPRPARMVVAQLPPAPLPEPPIAPGLPKAASPMPDAPAPPPPTPDAPALEARGPTAPGPSIDAENSPPGHDVLDGAPDPAATRQADANPAPRKAAKPPLPAGAPVRVLLRYVRTDAAASGRAASITTQLQAAGYRVQPDPSRFDPRLHARFGVRYFFAEDSGAAGEVLRAAGLPGQVVLAAGSDANSTPVPGLIELDVPQTTFDPPDHADPAATGHL